jgi:hypothetical protein
MDTYRNIYFRFRVNFEIFSSISEKIMSPRCQYILADNSTQMNADLFVKNVKISGRYLTYTIELLHVVKGTMNILRDTG